MSTWVRSTLIAFAISLPLSHLVLADDKALAALKKSADALWSVLAAPGVSPEHPSKELKKSLERPIYLTGWVIPNEYESGELVSFLLARYPSGCVHVPLPPPSNIVHVVMNEKSSKLKNIGSTKKVLVHGIIHSGGRVDSSYEMEADSIQEAI